MSTALNFVSITLDLTSRALNFISEALTYDLQIFNARLLLKRAQLFNICMNRKTRLDHKKRMIKQEKL